MNPKPFTREYTELEWSLAYEEAALPLGDQSCDETGGRVGDVHGGWRGTRTRRVQLADLQVDGRVGGDILG